MILHGSVAGPPPGILVAMSRTKEERAQARADKAAARAAKGPGRIRQVIQVFQMTRKADPRSVWLMAAAFVAPVLISILVAALWSGGFWLTFLLWVVLGVFTGILCFVIVLGRRAERVAYRQIEGRPGAVGAVVKSSLPRGWVGSEMPVNVSPRTQDAVYRVVGPNGIVLIAEGPLTRTRHMLEEERRKARRIVPNVEVIFLHVGPDEGSIPLMGLRRRIRKGKRTLRKTEVAAVNNRLQSLTPPLPVPKGVDPFRARPDHKAVRGR